MDRMGEHVGSERVLVPLPPEPQVARPAFEIDPGPFSLKDECVETVDDIVDGEGLRSRKQGTAPIATVATNLRRCRRRNGHGQSGHHEHSRPNPHGCNLPCPA